MQINPKQSENYSNQHHQDEDNVLKYLNIPDPIKDFQGKQIAMQNLTIQSQNLQQLLKYVATDQNNQNHIKEYLILVFKNDFQIIKLKYLMNTDRKLYFAHESQHINVQLSPQGYTLHLSNISYLIWNEYNLFTNKNWNHIQHLSLQGCPLFDKGWVNFVQNYKLFRNLKWLQIGGCQIQTIREGDLEKFQSIKRVDLIYLETELKSEQSNQIMLSPTVPLDSNKKLLIKSMQKLINYISTDQERQKQIFYSLSRKDLKKTISDMSDENQDLRLKSGLLIASLLYNNNETKRRFMKIMEIQLSEGRICINQIPHQIQNKNATNYQKIIQLIKSPLKQQVQNTLCWFINLKKKILEIQYLAYDKSKQFSFLDPLDCIFGFALMDENKEMNSKNVDKNINTQRSMNDQQNLKHISIPNSLNKKYLESISLREEEFCADYLITATNPLTNESKKVLDKYQQSHPKVIVIYSKQLTNYITAAPF